MKKADNKVSGYNKTPVGKKKPASGFVSQRMYSTSALDSHKGESNFQVQVQNPSCCAQHCAKPAKLINRFQEERKKKINVMHLKTPPPSNIADPKMSLDVLAQTCTQVHSNYFFQTLSPQPIRYHHPFKLCSYEEAQIRT